MKKTDLKKKKLGEVLVEAGLITSGQLEEALTLQRTTKRRLGRLFIELWYLDDTELSQTVSKQLKIPLVDLESTDPEEEALTKISEELARERVVIPVRIVAGGLTLAMANPLDWMTIQEVEFAAGMKVNVAIAGEIAILRALDRAFGLDDRATQDASAGLPETPDIDISKIAVEGFGTDIDSLYRAAEFPPVVQTFSMLLSEAIRTGASDLHLEPREKHVQVRMRVDGTLRNSLRYPRRAHDAIAARAKALTRLDLSNRVMPQEGSNRLSLGGSEINIRVSTLPSVNGESILISVAEKTKPAIEIGNLGLDPEMRRKVSALLHKGQGLLLLSGLKGSGRHTTEYALLKLLESDTLSIIGIGTAGSYSLASVKEISLNEAAGFTMPVAIASALKHDPDVIATGELSDARSASAALDAAMNGKLVISLIEAPEAASALARLASFEISSYILRSTVSGVLAQKLLKGICRECREELDVKDLSALEGLPKLDKAYTGRGCKKCGGTGLRGRVAVFEFLEMDQSLIRVLTDECTESSIKQSSQKSGAGTMFSDAWTKVSSGSLTVKDALSLKPS